MHNIKSNFDQILKVLKDILSDEVNEKGNYLRRGTVPRFSDVEVIALSLTAECLSIDGENFLFSKLKKEYGTGFANRISRRQYNDRRKLLFEKTERVRKLRSERLNRQADVFAIDSISQRCRGVVQQLHHHRRQRIYRERTSDQLIWIGTDTSGSAFEEQSKRAKAARPDTQESPQADRNGFFAVVRPVYDPAQLRQILCRLQIQDISKGYRLYRFAILKQIYLQPIREQS